MSQKDVVERLAKYKGKDIPLQSTQQIVMKTTAVDRAQGFAIKTQQLSLSMCPIAAPPSML